MRKYIVFLTVVLVLMGGVAATQDSADAHASQSGNQVAYIIAKVTYKTVDTDDYLKIFKKSHFRKNGTVGDVLAHAADDVCHAQGGKLEEDFSCSTPGEVGY